MKNLRNYLSKENFNKSKGIYSVCTSNEFVIRNSLKYAKSIGSPIVIESTCNQVDHKGGYSGMKPMDYKDYVYNIAAEVGYEIEDIILGGDHLGPHPYKHLNEAEAMIEAKSMVKEYILAGYKKIHLDCSMKLADDSLVGRLSDKVIARRTAELARVALDSYLLLKQSNPNEELPIFVIGSEVPVPGGAVDEELTVTSVEDLNQTLINTKEAFKKEGLDELFKNVIAIVVQPGVEFSSTHIHEYDRLKSLELVKGIEGHDILFEGHSTDYQTKEKLREMVEDNVGILKVGPQLTFSFREALFNMVKIEELLSTNTSLSKLEQTIYNEMYDNPKHWSSHYHNQTELELGYSLLDRVRYYYGNKNIIQSINRLKANINSIEIPDAIVSQHLPKCYNYYRENKSLSFDEIIYCHIEDVLDNYQYATKQ